MSEFFPWPPGRSLLRKLASKKHRRQYGVYLLEGEAAVGDALAAGAPLLGVLFDRRSSARGGDERLLQRLEAAGVPLHRVPEGVLEEVSGLTTPPPLAAVLRRERDAAPSQPPPPPLVLALDRVADPGNVGTLLRAAAFYGVREVWLGTGSAEAHSPKVLRAAMAAHLHLRVCEQVNLAAELAGAKRSGARVLAAEMEGVERSAGSLPGRGAGQVLVLGSEAHGVDPALIELADERLAIARRGPIDSLNVAMAGTVLLDRLLPFTEQTTP